MIEKNYELRRSNRRTLALTLDRQGRLIIHAPMRMPLRTIEAFILEKQDWIARKRQELSAAGSRMSGFSLEEGGCIPYLGGRVRISYDSVHRATMQDGVLTLPRTGRPAQQVLNWLAEQARRELSSYVEKWSKRMNIYPTALSFGYAKARYGRTGRYTGSITAPHHGTGRMEHPSRNNQSDCEWKGTCRRQSCYN